MHQSRQQREFGQLRCIPPDVLTRSGISGVEAKRAGESWKGHRWRSQIRVTLQEKPCLRPQDIASSDARAERRMCAAAGCSTWRSIDSKNRSSAPSGSA